MESSIVYNAEGLLDGTVNTGSEGCVSQWANGRLISHYREMGAGWSIRVFKFTTGHYYYSHKQIDYDAQVLREEICVYRYGLRDMIAPGMTVFCAYKWRPTFRVVEATERMIADNADNVLTPLQVLDKKTLVKDIRAVLEEGSAEDIFELLEVPMPGVNVMEEVDDVLVEKGGKGGKGEEGEGETFLDKTFNCGLSAIVQDEEEVDVTVDVDTDGEDELIPI